MDRRLLLRLQLLRADHRGEAIRPNAVLVATVRVGKQIHRMGTSLKFIVYLLPFIT